MHAHHRCDLWCPAKFAHKHKKCYELYIYPTILCSSRIRNLNYIIADCRSVVSNIGDRCSNEIRSLVFFGLLAVRFLSVGKIFSKMVLFSSMGLGHVPFRLF